MILRSGVDKQRLSSAARWAMLLGASGVLVFALIPPGIQFEGHLTDGVVVPLVEIVTLAAILYVSVNPGGRLGQVLKSRWLVWFGKYSYGIYVYHCLWTPWTRAHFPRISQHYSVNVLIHLVRYVAVPVAVAVVSYHAFELPILRFKDRGSVLPRAVPAVNGHEPAKPV